MSARRGLGTLLVLAAVFVAGRVLAARVSGAGLPPEFAAQAVAVPLAQVALVELLLRRRGTRA